MLSLYGPSAPNAVFAPVLYGACRLYFTLSCRGLRSRRRRIASLLYPPHLLCLFQLSCFLSSVYPSKFSLFSDFFPSPQKKTSRYALLFPRILPSLLFRHISFISLLPLIRCTLSSCPSQFSIDTMRFRSRSSASRRNHNKSIDNSALIGPVDSLERAIREADVRRSEGYRRGIRPDYPTFIQHGSIRLLVSASPTKDTLPSYLKTLSVHQVTHVVRVCEPMYDPSLLTNAGVTVHDCYFDDGLAPPDHVIHQWLALLDNLFDLKNLGARSRRDSSTMSDVTDADFSPYSSDTSLSPSSSADGAAQPTVKQTVAVHCAAGIGRAPVLAAVALVEAGLEPMEAVGWIRALRRGAINATQLAFLQAYVPRCFATPESKAKSRGKLSFLSAFRYSRTVRSRAASDEKLPIPSQPSSSMSSPASSGSQRSLPVQRLQLPESAYSFF